MFTSRTRITLAIAAIGLLAAGCSDDSESMPGMDHGASSSASSSSAVATSSPGARTDFNDADVAFLQGMYPHHAQAVEMAELVPGRSQNPQLLALATAVEQAQAPEMQQMSTLLQSFGKPAPSASGEHGGHGSTMPGMMSTEQMNALRAANGTAFDRQWLEMMIQHHQGAIAMAEPEIAHGVNPESVALARAVVSAQQAEIDTMNGMLAALPN
ncbi:DUF305 domain-containing protein [Nocardia goodfellowii]|uniref:Uncharacterized protein (DUF305 family) n=1 Tax=Nocardia goodfellowii TaxID=882446 RepID=A0ABS4QBS0_9NOCA|nr:DUF305 domain-containing protein [Nocardia goodfellowii]MBP2189145.1 uncharacterized protein (DUF305 family) [Nocardia goodfellowii]